MTVVQQHDVVIRQVVLAEVRALLRHREVALLVGAPAGRGSGRGCEGGGRGRPGGSWGVRGLGPSPEEPGVLHVPGVVIVGLPGPEAHPKEVLGLLAFVDDLWEKGLSGPGPRSAPAGRRAPPPAPSPACCRRRQTWCSGCPPPAWPRLGRTPGPPTRTRCPGCPRSQREPGTCAGSSSRRQPAAATLLVRPRPTHNPTLRMKQNSELRRLESVLIWMHLGGGRRQRGVPAAHGRPPAPTRACPQPGTGCRGRCHWCGSGRGWAAGQPAPPSSCRDG